MTEVQFQAGAGKNSFVSVIASRLALGPTQPHPMGTGGSFPGCKVVGA